MPGNVTEPNLKEKVELEDKIVSESKVFTTTDKNIFNVTPFAPAKEYSLELKAKVTSATGRGLDFEARNNNGTGFRFSIDESGISNTSDLSSPSRLAWMNTDEEKTYRFAVKGDWVYVYCEKEYIGSVALCEISKINEDDTESTAATFSDDIMPDWAGPNNKGTGKPNDYGWDCTVATSIWNNANVSAGIRFLDNQNHAYNGSTYAGRLMTIRWDSDDIRNAYFSFPLTLEANTTYELSFVYELWANADPGVSINAGISTTKNGTGVIASGTYVTGAALNLQDGVLRFTTNAAGQYYMVFSGNARAMFGIGGFELKTYSSEPSLIVGKNYNNGSLDAQITYISYQDGAYAASDVDSPVETQYLSCKKKRAKTGVDEREVRSHSG